jgi:hypothetical protein
VYAAKVASIADTLGMGRIQMYIPQIFGATPVRVWAPPLIQQFLPPVIGQVVWCIFQGGDPAYPTYLPVNGIPASYPRGAVAQRSTTANSSNTTTTAGSTVTWLTLPAITTDGTRRIKVSAIGMIQGTTAGDISTLNIADGATIIQYSQGRHTIAGGNGQIVHKCFWEGVPAAGTHTYSLLVQYLGGTRATGPVVGVASATHPTFLLAEDIGV